jgi:hypothetical protein
LGVQEEKPYQLANHGSSRVRMLSCIFRQAYWVVGCQIPCNH